ncbi:PAS domain-containing protein, partial [Desulforhopalus singaporensis]
MFIKNPEDIQQLDVSNGDLHPILSILNIGIVITDDKGVITFYNSVHAEIDGLRPADVIGRKICDFTEVDENSSLIMRCLRTSRPVIECPVLYKNRNGKIVDSINSVFPLVKNGKVVGV